MFGFLKSKERKIIQQLYLALYRCVAAGDGGQEAIDALKAAKPFVED